MISEGLKNTILELAKNEQPAEEYVKLYYKLTDEEKEDVKIFLKNNVIKEAASLQLLLEIL